MVLNHQSMLKVLYIFTFQGSRKQVQGEETCKATQLAHGEAETTQESWPQHRALCGTSVALIPRPGALNTILGNVTLL